MDIIRAENVFKVYRDFWGRPKVNAVKNFNLTVKEGEIFGLLGPNGAGKSTFVKMLLGLLNPTHGEIRIWDSNILSNDVKARVGYLPENTCIYNFLTAEETLEFYGSLFPVSSDEVKSRSRQLLKMVGLSHAANRLVGEFSKGMARRIGLAQAMINDPDLIVLDEPTNGLDPIGCREIKDLLLMLKSRGKTIFITSHLLGDMEEICDRVGIMYGGELAALGRLDDLLSVPDAREVRIPADDAGKLEQVLSFVNKTFPDREVEITTPRSNLEEFFMKTVGVQHGKNGDISGASAGEVADYLKSDKLAELLDKPDDVFSDQAAAGAHSGAGNLQQSSKVRDYSRSNEKLKKLIGDK